MTQYINTETLEYPVLKQDILMAFPNTSFESDFKPPYPFVEVIEVITTTQNPYQKITEAFPVYSNGQWNKSYVIKDMTPTEIQAINYKKASLVRNKRSALLLQSDWTQVLDAPVDRQAWSTYRQALRDITNQPGFPLEVTWPQQPSN